MNPLRHLSRGSSTESGCSGHLFTVLWSAWDHEGPSLWTERTHENEIVVPVLNSLVWKKKNEMHGMQNTWETVHCPSLDSGSIKRRLCLFFRHNNSLWHGYNTFQRGWSILVTMYNRWSHSACTNPWKTQLGYCNSVIFLHSRELC